MKAAGLVLVPLSIAWIGGGSWYIVQHHVEARSAPRLASPPPEPIRLGPPPAPPPPSPIPAIALPTARTVRFAKNTGAFELSEEDRAWCLAAIEFLEQRSNASVHVMGFTDGDGDEEVNRRLSQARARLVGEQLVAAGIPEDRLRIEGMGAADPVSDNVTSKGKALNRRVELRMVAAP